MLPWEEALRAEAVGITVLHRIPARHVVIASKQTLMQARLTGKITFTSVLINQAPFLQVLMVGILCT